MASGCVPLAPNRLAYREYVSTECRYQSDEQNAEAEAIAALDCFQEILKTPPALCPPNAWKSSELAHRYRMLINELITKDQRA